MNSNIIENQLSFQCILISQVLDQAGQASKEEFEKLENVVRTREMKNKHDDNDKKQFRLLF